MIDREVYNRIMEDYSEMTFEQRRDNAERKKCDRIDKEVDVWIKVAKESLAAMAKGIGEDLDKCLNEMQYR